MKSPILFTLSLFLIAESLSTPFEPVMDTDENPIFLGGRFYIMPYIFGPTGGGIRFDTTENITCPVPLLQEYSEVVNGLPVHFYVQGITPGIIYTRRPLKIQFDVKPECGWWFDWEVIRGEKQLGSIIGVGYSYDEGINPIIEGSFWIHKHGLESYKLEFCPVLGDPIGICYDVGRKDTENGRHLVLTSGDPYEIVFVKADLDDSSI